MALAPIIQLVNKSEKESSMESRECTIELQEVNVHFGPVEVLNRVNLKIYKGECFVIIGPSGQGKTTLLKSLAGLVQPTAGIRIVDGKNTKILSSEETRLLTLKMGMLFQKNALFDSLTVGDNIAFPLRELTKKSESEIQSIVDQFLNAVGISHAKNLFPDEISGGMQKRLGIARALALKPEIIFYDDPTAGLDPITSRKIIELILALKNQNGSTVVAITNDINRAFQMADRLGFVYDKQVLVLGSPEQTRGHLDPRVQQFIHGHLAGPLTDKPKKINKD
jgi:phospholipid/cholesterol/gamma-HCH transport system ATP-binding protein